MKLFVVSSLIAVAVAAPPQLPLDWSAEEVSALVIASGTTTVGDNICCAADAANCKVQIQGSEGMHYFDFTHNRTRMDSGGQSIVSDYILKKELLVVGGVCQEYCPIQDELEPFDIDPKARNLGPREVDGKQTTMWRHRETILGIITMEIDDIYVDADETPIMEHESITPFGQHLGDSNTTWTNFKGGPQDASLFVVANVTDCKISQNCGSNARQVKRLREKNWRTWAYYQQGVDAIAKEELEL